MAITVIKEDERKLLSENDIDIEFLDKFVLVDCKGLDDSVSGGTTIAFGDQTDEVWNELFQFGQSIGDDILLMIMSGLKERGGHL